MIRKAFRTHRVKLLLAQAEELKRAMQSCSISRWLLQGVCLRTRCSSLASHWQTSRPVQHLQPWHLQRPHRLWGSAPAPHLHLLVAWGDDHFCSTAAAGSVRAACVLCRCAAGLLGGASLPACCSCCSNLLACLPAVARTLNNALLHGLLRACAELSLCSCPAGDWPFELNSNLGTVTLTNMQTPGSWPD